MQARFALPSRRAAMALMRRMRHVQEGRELYVTEEWLAEWLIDRALPGLDQPKAQSFNPLTAAVDDRAKTLLQRLVRNGELHVNPSLIATH